MHTEKPVEKGDGGVHANRREIRYLSLYCRFLGDFYDVSPGSRGKGSVSALAATQGQVGRGGQTIAELCSKRRAKPTFSRILAQFFNEDITEWTRVVMSVGMHLRRFAVIFPVPKSAGQVSLPELLLIRE